MRLFILLFSCPHVSQRWPDFRNWLISKSGYPWTGEETRGRAEGVVALGNNKLLIVDDLKEAILIATEN